MKEAFETSCTVRGNARTGRYPYIWFRGLNYSNERLRKRPSLIGKQIIVKDNPQDIRVLEARLRNGQRLGTLQLIGGLPIMNKAIRNIERKKKVRRLPDDIL